MLRQATILFCLFLLCTSQSVFAQDSKAYSQKKESFIKKSRFSDVPSLLKKAKANQEKSPEKALEYVEEALVASQQQNNKIYIAQCYTLIGDINQNIEEWDLAIESYIEAENIYNKRKGSDPEKQHIRLQLGHCHKVQGRFKKAIEYYARYKNASQTNEENFKADIALGDLYYQNGNFDNALSNYQSALKVAKSDNDNVKISIAKAKLAKVYADQNQNQLAEDLIFETEELILNDSAELSYNTTYDFEPLSEAKEQVITNYRQEDRFDKEIDLRQRNIQMDVQEDEDPASPGLSGKNRGKKKEEYIISENRKLGESFLASGRVDEAIPQLERAIELAEKVNSKEEKAQGYKSLSSALAQRGDYEKALEQYELYVKEKDEILTAKEIKLQKSREVLKKQGRIKESEKDVALFSSYNSLEAKDKELLAEQYLQQKLITYALLLLLIVLSVTTYVIYRNAKAKRKANQLLALKSLRSQMNPHFIFNALNSVNSFISKNDEKSANKFLSQFSKLMRLVLENSQEDFVTLKEELTVIELYLQLEQYRFRDKFEYEYDVDEEIEGEATQIPPMLIQPFIENAVWHGLRYKESFGKLKVTFKNSEKAIEVEIADNGIGRKKSLDLKTKNQDKNSKGLKNTQERIAIINSIYKTKYELSIEDLNPDEKDCGTKVTLILPTNHKNGSNT